MKNKVYYVVLFLLFSWTALIAQTDKTSDEKPHDAILETVNVENIVVPVRVFAGKKMVSGLSKDDFVLLVNGKKYPITGFYEQRKKITDPAAVNPSEQNPSPSRLFVLIFNLSDYHQDLKSLMDVFFTDIARPDDYLIVISNHFFFPEWKLTNPQKTKENLLALLEKEKNIIKNDLQWFQNELRSIAINFYSRLNDEAERALPDYPVDIFKEFFINYELIIEDMQRRYLDLPEERFIQIASYLKSQNRDKWVFNFFQVGQLPLLDTFGGIQKEMSKYLDANGTVGREIANLNFKYLKLTTTEENILLKDIGKLFVDSGATFHTMLLKPLNPGFSQDFKFQSVSTDAETLLKKISAQTGGKVFRSNNIKKFTRELTLMEDIVYVLAYAPNRKLKNADLAITTTNQNYRVEYDNRSRIKPFERTLKKMNLEKPPVTIEKMSLNGQELTVQLSNIKLVQEEQEPFGAIQAKIKIENNHAKVLAAFEKTYKGLKAEGIFKVQLPPLSKGKYTVVLEVKDLFSLDNRFIGDAITTEIK